MASDVKEARERLRNVTERWVKAKTQAPKHAGLYEANLIPAIEGLLDLLDAADQADEGRCDQKTRWRCGECDVHLVGCDCECHKDEPPVCEASAGTVCKHCAEVFTRDPMRSDDGRCICACHAPAAKEESL